MTHSLWYLVTICCSIGLSYYKFVFDPNSQNLSLVFAVWGSFMVMASWLSLILKINKMSKWLRFGIVLLFYYSLLTGYEMLNYQFYHTLVLPNQVFSWISAPLLGMAVAYFIDNSKIEKYKSIAIPLLILLGITISMSFVYYFVPFYITIPISIIVWLISLLRGKTNVKT